MAKAPASIDPDTLKQLFGEVIEEGDTLLVHSSLGAIGWLGGGPQSLIQILLNLVGRRGTLVMPTATTYFSKTAEFDLEHSQSMTGLLSETFRKYPGVQRSPVPMASFSAIGRDSERFTRRYDSYLDESSPFSGLLGLNGKVLLYGVDYNKCTLFHLAEERSRVEYNFYKTFKGWSILPDGQRIETSQTYFVRKDMAIKKDVMAVGRRFEQCGHVFKRSLGNGTIRIFSARKFDAFCMSEITQNPRVFVADDNG